MIPLGEGPLHRLQRAFHLATSYQGGATRTAGWVPYHQALVVLGRNNPSLYTVKGRPLYVHLNGLAIVLLK